MDAKSNFDSDFYPFLKGLITALSSSNISEPFANGENVSTKSSNNSSSFTDILNKYSEVIDQNSTSLANILNEKSKEDMDRKKDYFIKLLKTTKFEDGIDNEVTEYFSRLMQDNTSVALQWINSIYNESFSKKDDEIVIKILDLLSDYPLEEVKPNGQIMMVLGLANKNRFVQAKALKVLEHWMDYETLNMAGEIVITSPWVSMMFDKIKDKIEKKHVSKSL